MKMREQRLIGAALVIMSGILIALACSGTTQEDRDVTAVLLTLPLGLYMIFADSAPAGAESTITNARKELNQWQEKE